MLRFWTFMYRMKRVDADGLKEVVTKGYITAEEYKTITGTEYKAA